MVVPTSLVLHSMLKSGFDSGFDSNFGSGFDSSFDDYATERIMIGKGLRLFFAMQERFEVWLRFQLRQLRDGAHHDCEKLIANSLLALASASKATPTPPYFGQSRRGSSPC